MANVFRRRIHRPLPAGATVGKWNSRTGTAQATWTDTKGNRQTCDVERGDDGQPVRLTDNYFMKYRDHKGRVVVETTGMASRDGAERVLSERLQRAEHIKSGVLTESQAKVADASKVVIADHITAYESAMSPATTAKHRRDALYRLRRVVADIGAKTVGEIDREAVEGWINAQLQSGRLSRRTINNHVGSLKLFLSWACRTRRLSGMNGVEHIRPLPVSADLRIVRRALTRDEFDRLVAASSPERRFVYAMAVLTGLRANELGTLKWCDIVGLGTGQARIELVAGNTKSKRADIVPVHPDLERELIERLKAGGYTADDLVMDIDPTDQARLLKADLKRAGIPYKDTQGRQADFHALRKTFVTWLAASGADMRTVQSLARHSTIQLTAGTYTDASQLPMNSAIRGLGTVYPVVYPDRPILTDFNPQKPVNGAGSDNGNTERKPHDTKTYGEFLPASVVDSHGYEIRQINDDI